MRNFIPLFFLTLTSFYSAEINAQCSTANPAGCSCPTPGATDCVLLPDITAGKKSLNNNQGWTEYSQSTPGENKGLLRVDVATPNIGWGPLEIFPTDDYICGTDTMRNFNPPPGFHCPGGGDPKRLIKQRLFHKVGNTMQFDSRDAGWMQYHTAHGHIHVDGWGLYTLRLRDVSVADTLLWPIVNKGIKVSFCLIDLTTCSGSAGDCRDSGGNILLNNNFPNYGLGGGYSCGESKQGISVGKVDIYHQSLDESFVKIPYEACNGTYHVVIQIDPDNHFLEMDDTNNWLAAETVLTRQRTSNTNPYSYIFSKKGNIICQNETLELEASGANKYLWSTGETTQKISVAGPGRYWVQATTPCGIATSDTLDVFVAPSSTIPSEIRTDTVCTGGAANLFASGNAHWYDAPVGGNLLYVGNNFATSNLNSSTTFYVSDQPSMQGGKLGPQATSFSGDGNYITPRKEYLIFNAFLPFKIKTVKVDASLAGQRIFQLRDMYGNVLTERSVFVNAGEQTITLDFFVPSGLNLQLGLSGSSPATSLYASTTSSANIGYPFSLASIGNIVGSSLGDATYPFCYDWEVEGTPQACNINVQREPVTAFVTTPPAVSISGLEPVYLHTASPVNITVSPAGGLLTGNGISGNQFNPALAGVGQHEIRYTFAMGQCGNSTSRYVTVEFDSASIVNGYSIQVMNSPGYSQQLFVQTKENTKVEVRLMNSIGQQLFRKEFSASIGGNRFDLDLTRLPKGIYIVQARLANNGFKKAIKIIR